MIIKISNIFIAKRDISIKYVEIVSTGLVLQNSYYQRYINKKTVYIYNIYILLILKRTN